MGRTAIELLLAGVLLSGVARAGSQQPSDLAGRAVNLAMAGRCEEALPMLTQAVREATEKDVRLLTGEFGVRCAMLLNRQSAATTFLNRLQQESPNDPRVLFLAIHLYSDLAYRNAQQLMKVAPNSLQVLQLNAEDFEKAGNAKGAIGEYRVILKRAPATPGIHYRIGGLIFEHLGVAGTVDEARQEFEAELKINPQNAGAEYYLGELARRADKLPDAIQHFSRAASLAPNMPDAQFGLGRSLLDSGKTAEAVGPLEKASHLAPDNPTVHFTLGTAYERMGRKQDAAREFALQKSAAAKLNAGGVKP